MELDAEKAFFSGEIDALVATIHENERPLAGLSGLVDWRLCGVISETLRRGVLTGKAGECAYFPVTRHGKTSHLFLVGAGPSPAPGERKALPPESAQALRKNLVSMKLSKVGISRRDLGGLKDPEIQKRLEGVSLWIAP